MYIYIFSTYFAHCFLNLHERSWQTFLAKPETEMSKMRIQKTRGWLCSEGSQVFAIVKRYRLPIFCQMTELHFCFFNFALFLEIAHKNSSKMFTTRAYDSNVILVMISIKSTIGHWIILAISRFFLLFSFVLCFVLFIHVLTLLFCVYILFSIRNSVTSLSTSSFSFLYT